MTTDHFHQWPTHHYKNTQNDVPHTPTTTITKRTRNDSYAMVACIILALPGMLYEQAARRGQQLVHGMMYDLVQLFLTG